LFKANTAASGGAINTIAINGQPGFTDVQATGVSFIDNTATSGGGGAIFAYTLLGDQITDCRFVGNTAAASAGGAISEWASGSTIADSTFLRNSAGTGGALSLGDEAVAISGTVIRGNSSTGIGGGIYAGGGDGISIADSKITGNHADGDGGGAYLGAGVGQASVSSTIIAGNSAADGGGIIDGGGVSIDYAGDTIAGNRASGDGGGINASSSVLFAGPVLFHRHAGGIHYGRDLAPDYPSVSFNDSTISGNSAGGRGGGIHNQGSFSASRTRITGNRAAHGGGGIYDDGAGATVALTKSLLAGNKPDNCEPLKSITGCTG
jgi:predicted outer membrane repeat protein